MQNAPFVYSAVECPYGFLLERIALKTAARVLMSVAAVTREDTTDGRENRRDKSLCCLAQESILFPPQPLRSPCWGEKELEAWEPEQSPESQRAGRPQGCGVLAGVSREES